MLTNVHFPLLPFDLVALHPETNAFGLNNMQGLHVVTKLEVFIILDDEVGEEIKFPGRRRDTLSIAMIQRCDIQWVRSRCGCR